jgi:hypothetical protein
VEGEKKPEVPTLALMLCTNRKIGTFLSILKEGGEEGGGGGGRER